MMREWIVALFACATAAATPPLARAEAPRPNIVVILADDLGNADLGYRGGEIRTPNIDGLARDGVRLESFYGQLVCTPSRAALMTGRYPMRYGLQTLVIFPSHAYGLPTDERTLSGGSRSGHDRHQPGAARDAAGAAVAPHEPLRVPERRGHGPARRADLRPRRVPPGPRPRGPARPPLEGHAPHLRVEAREKVPSDVDPVASTTA